MANIIGTWALVRTEAVDANDKPTRVAPFGGTNVIGRVVFTKDGRMSAAITDARSEIPNGETREYSCYAGAYTLDGNTLKTKVDACSDPARMPSLLVMDCKVSLSLQIKLALSGAISQSKSFLIIA